MFFKASRYLDINNFVSSIIYNYVGTTRSA